MASRYGAPPELATGLRSEQLEQASGPVPAIQATLCLLVLIPGVEAVDVALLKRSELERVDETTR
jgi:hypothetical protein